MPDFVDLEVSGVLGSFIAGEIVNSEQSVGNQTARGKVISWAPDTAILRVEPIPVSYTHLTLPTNREV